MFRLLRLFVSVIVFSKSSKLDPSLSRTHSIEWTLTCLPPLLWRYKTQQLFLEVSGIFPFKESLGDDTYRIILISFYLEKIWADSNFFEDIILQDYFSSKDDVFLSNCKNDTSLKNYLRSLFDVFCPGNTYTQTGQNNKTLLSKAETNLMLSRHVPVQTQE